MKLLLSETEAAEMLRTEARPFVTAADDDGVLNWIGDTSLVLLGEASHGTHDFHAARARLTRRLIEERGFAAVAVEGDWPDAERVNRHVHGWETGSADAALAGFTRFPAWMWRNTAVAEFVGWLQAHNAARAPQERVGFHGLDLYSLRTSMRAVIAYLERHDPAAAQAARSSYACFDQFGGAGESYAWAAGKLGGSSCEDAVTRQLAELHRRRVEFLRRDGEAGTEDFFSATQNARLARSAERYYRTMLQGRSESWNIRDAHMAETLAELIAHLRSRKRAPKIVVWAHNSHLGDARATEMSEHGELSLGQLARERYGAEVKSIGFTTYTGTVMAAWDWGAVGEVCPVRPALPGSYEELFHEVGLPRFFLPLAADSAAGEVLYKRRLERAIGVIYRPDTERTSHYFSARLARQFDAMIHFDRTQAVTPLDATQPPSDGEPPETFPDGT
jgi:erythromycin esterase-like protein